MARTFSNGNNIVRFVVEGELEINYLVANQCTT